MKLCLLDTQAFIDGSHSEESLSVKAREWILHPKTTPYLSMASVWEMQIKIQLGKLKFPVELSQVIQRGITQIGMELLPIRLEHILALSRLEWHHRDPFDRLIAAQALHEKLPLIAKDEMFDPYGVDRIW